MKRFIFLIIGLLLTCLGIILISGLVGGKLGAGIKEDLKLKVPKEKVLKNWDFEENGVKGRKYSYVNLESTTINENGKTELIDKRTTNSYTFDKGKDKEGKQKFETVFLTDNAFVKNKLDNKWYGVEYATTTEEAFIQQLSLNWIEKIKNRIVEPVYGADFYPDADPETTTVDGFAGFSSSGTGCNKTLSEIISANGNINQPSGTTFGPYLSSSSTLGYYCIETRAMALFDTSSIGSGSTINSASLNLYGDWKVSGFSTPQTVEIVTSSLNSNTFITTSDYERNVGNKIRLATGMTTTATQLSQYNVFNFNTDGKNAISLTGITKLGIKFSSDIDGTITDEASKTTYVDYLTAENSGTTTDPKLIVDYTGSTPTTSNSIESDTIYFD